MKPPSFEYVRATTVPEAVSALSTPDAKALAGGQSLVPLLNLRLARPATLVDLNGVAGLGELTTTPTTLEVGALARHRALAEQSHHPLAAQAARWIGHRAIRNRGTIGGSLAHADPAAEWPVVALACDATVTVAGPAGERRLAVAELLDGPFSTTLEDGELLIGVTLPVPSRWGFAELARRHGDFALVLAAVAQLIDGSWRVAVGGVGPGAVRCPDAEAVLDGAPLADERAVDGPALDAAARAAVAGLRPSDDIHASGAYRRHLAEVLVGQALQTVSGSRP